MKKIYEVTTPEIVPDNVYLGGDIHTFEANIIGTKSFLDDVRPIEALESAQINGIFNATIDLKNSLYGVEKINFSNYFNTSSKKLQNQLVKCKR